jgi:hypothetical protein
MNPTAVLDTIFASDQDSSSTSDILSLPDQSELQKEIGDEDSDVEFISEGYEQTQSVPPMGDEDPEPMEDEHELFEQVILYKWTIKYAR